MTGGSNAMGFMPHGMCFLWNPQLLSLHVISDAIIAIAYYSIPIVLLAFVHKRKDIPYPGVFAMFGVFIVACGTTHVLDIYTVWHPIYWIAGAMKAFTAIVSIITAFLLVKIIPGALALRSPAELDALNGQLAISAERDRATAAKLLEKNRLMAMAEQIAHVGHWRFDLASNKLYWSDEIYRTYGLPMSTTPTLETVIEAYHPEERDRVRAILDDAVANGEPYWYEARIVRPDGLVRDVVASGQSERGDDDSVVATFGVLQDVTELKDAERERERLVERVTAATQDARLGIWEWDLATRSLVWDPVMYDLYGWDEASVAATYESWIDAIHTDDRARVEREIRLAVSGSLGFDTEFRILWPSGELRYIRATGAAILADTGPGKRMVGTNWDVTQARTLAEHLRREKDAATFKASHDTLTGLLNRRGLEAWLNAKPDLVATLLYLDLDGFKAVNDGGGHDAGDATLRDVAKIINDATRDSDGVARMGGDEFVVVLPGAIDGKGPDAVIRRIATAVAALTPLGAEDGTRVGMSIGVGYLDGRISFAEALRIADTHLYREKNGRSGERAFRRSNRRSIAV